MTKRDHELIALAEQVAGKVKKSCRILRDILAEVDGNGYDGGDGYIQINLTKEEIAEIREVLS